MRQKPYYLKYIYFGLGVFLVIVGFFLGVKLVHRFSSEPPVRIRQTNVEQVQPWMTLPYISKAYGVPREEFVKQLNIPENISLKKNISELAPILGTSESDLLFKIKEVIRMFQLEHQTPPPRREENR